MHCSLMSTPEVNKGKIISVMFHVNGSFLRAINQPYSVIYKDVVNSLGGSILWDLQPLVFDMITRSFLTAALCCGFFICMLPKASAKRNTGVKEYTIGEQRTRKRQNYVEQVALDNEMFDNADDVGPPYESKATENDDNKEDLPALIVDYANLIRNDIILLDNSVETRTRKRGNVKVEKHNQVISDVPCSCEYNKHMVDLGDSCYPRILENRTCSEQMCRPPYKCQPNIYELTILKRRTSVMEHSAIDIPSDLRHRWIAQKQSVTIGCMCTRDYIIDN